MSVDLIHTKTTGAPVHAARPGSTVADTATGIIYLRRDDSTWQQVGGSTTVPGGADTQVQFNSSGTFAGSADFTFDGTGLWVYGGSGDTVNIKLGSDAAATLAAGQHFLDFGNTLQQDPGLGTDGQVIRLKGIGVLANSTIYYGLDTGGRLFLMTDVNHRWHFTGVGSDNPVYDWGKTGFVVTTRNAADGIFDVQFRTGLITLSRPGSPRRSLKIDAALLITPNAASNFFITGLNFAAEDIWEIKCTGANSHLEFKSSGSIDLRPVGIRASTGDFGVRIAPDQQMILTLAGFFAFVDILNKDFDGTTFWRPNSGTGTGFGYGMGSTTPLKIDTLGAAGSAFYAYGANLNPSGSGTIGFWQYRNNGTIISSMSLAGDIVAGNYTAIADQNLDVTAGTTSAAGAGRTITLAGTDGVTAGDGGDVVLLPGALAGGGANGRVDFALAANVVGVPAAGAIAAVDPQEFVRVKVDGVNRTLAVYLNV